MVNTFDLDEKKLSELELRGALHNMIERIDAMQLSHFFRLLKESLSDEEDFQLTPEQEKELEIGIAQTYDPTKLIPHSEVMKMMKEW
jgi:hypothetical protein